MADTKMSAQADKVGRRLFISFWAPIIAMLVIGFVVAWMFVEPAPPKKATIAAGRQGGDYHRVAQAYAKLFKENHIDLEVKTTNGSVENYAELDAGKVDLALVQGGTLPEKRERKLEAIASVYLEPMWIFYRGKDMDRLDQLSGKRIAVGPEGSGTRALAMRLLQFYGMTDPATKTELLPTPAGELVKAFQSNTIDAAMIVSAPRATILRDLLGVEGVEAMSLRHAPAIARNLSFLKTVTAHEGSIDLRANLPNRSIELVAPAAMLVARDDTHEALVLLACESAVKTHGSADLMTEAGEFPTMKYLELPVNPVAEHYLRKGPSLLNRHFPFWLASLLERMTILLLPLLTLLIPLMRFAPPLYAWRIRAKIYRWYKELRAIEIEMAMHPEPSSDIPDRLAKLRTEIQHVEVPLSYMHELYDLIEHVDLLQRQIATKKPN